MKHLQYINMSIMSSYEHESHQQMHSRNTNPSGRGHDLNPCRKDTRLSRNKMPKP